MIELAFLAAVSVLWCVVLWGLTIAFAGSLYAQRRTRGAEWRARIARRAALPGVTVLVPAHNEARVIRRSIATYLALDYPADRFELIVVNDASTDATGAICDEMAAADARVRVVHIPPDRGGRGKAAALNLALPACRHRYVAVYDADNRPRPDALRLLVAEIEDRRDARGYGAAVGRIVKMNRRATLLNRFASFEFAAFQWTLQAGRAQLFDVVMIPGTNFVIETELLRSLGGWDPAALTEDLELSVRLHAAGRRVAFVPEAVSEEQDPQRLRPWFRQRVRWLRGNYYVLGKHLRGALRHPRRGVTGPLLSMTLVFVLFLIALVVSDAIAIAGVAGLVSFDLPGPYLALWLGALAAFIATFQLTQALEGEDDWRTPLLAALMYATYTQLWLLVAARSTVATLFGKRGFVWESTPRSHD